MRIGAGGHQRHSGRETQTRREMMGGDSNGEFFVIASYHVVNAGMGRQQPADRPGPGLLCFIEQRSIGRKNVRMQKWRQLNNVCCDQNHAHRAIPAFDTKHFGQRLRLARITAKPKAEFSWIRDHAPTGNNVCRFK